MATLTKVNMKDLENLSFEEGKKLLKNLGYVNNKLQPQNIEKLENGISDYVSDQYFSLYDEENIELDTVSFEIYYNRAGENEEIVKTCWWQLY